MNDINLLGNRRQKSSETKRYLTWLNNLSLVILIAVTFSGIVVFLLLVLSPYQTLNKNAADITNALNHLSSKAGKVYLINERASAIKTIIEKRHYYYKYTNALLQALPSDVLVEDFSIDRESLTFSASSNSLLSLDTFFNNLIQHVQNKTFFKSVLLNSLLVDTKKNKYTASLVVDLL